MTQEVVQVEEKLQPAVVTQVKSPIEATNQPSSTMPAKSTTKRKMLKWRIVQFVFN